MTASYEQLAQAPLKTDNILAQIAGVARDILAAQIAVDEAEEALRQAKQHLKTLQEDVMPELMAAAGQEELTTIDGLKVSITDMVRGQPTKEKEREAFKWLRDGGNGGIIKSEINVDLGKAKEEEIKKAVDALRAAGLTKAFHKQSVHWQTLGSLVREKLSKGEDVPLELLGVHMWKQAVVKPK
jgi:hypothetical protein